MSPSSSRSSSNEVRAGFFFFWGITAFLRYILRTIQFTHFQYTIQCFLGRPQIRAAIVTASEHHHLKEKRLICQLSLPYPCILLAFTFQGGSNQRSVSGDFVGPASWLWTAIMFLKELERTLGGRSPTPLFCRQIFAWHQAARGRCSWPGPICLHVLPRPCSAA